MLHVLVYAAMARDVEQWLAGAVRLLLKRVSSLEADLANLKIAGALVCDASGVAGKPYEHDGSPATRDMDVPCDPDYDNAHIANSSVVVLKLDPLLFGEEFVMDPNAVLLVPADRCGGADGHPAGRKVVSRDRDDLDLQVKAVVHPDVGDTGDPSAPPASDTVVEDLALGPVDSYQTGDPSAPPAIDAVVENLALAIASSSSLPDAGYLHADDDDIDIDAQPNLKGESPAHGAPSALPSDTAVDGSRARDDALEVWNDFVRDEYHSIDVVRVIGMLVLCLDTLSFCTRWPLAFCVSIINAIRGELCQNFVEAFSSHGDAGITEHFMATFAESACSVIIRTVTCAAGSGSSVLVTGCQTPAAHFRDQLVLEDKTQHVLDRDEDIQEQLKVEQHSEEAVRRILNLVADFALGHEVEAALLLMNKDMLSELLDGEAGLRSKLTGMTTSCERVQKMLWLCETLL